jgi:hypothetical protein
MIEPKRNAGSFSDFFVLGEQRPFGVRGRSWPFFLFWNSQFGYYYLLSTAFACLLADGGWILGVSIWREKPVLF